MKFSGSPIIVLIKSVYSPFISFPVGVKTLFEFTNDLFNSIL
jgi:hypothetical protein